MTTIYLVRHGETQWNASKRIQGQADSPLTEQGKIQAKQVAGRAKQLGITHVFTSDLGRAIETAEIIAKELSLPIQIDKRLRELDMGILEGRFVNELTPEEDELRRSPLSGTADARIPNGESMQELADRLHLAINELRMLPEGSTPLLICHGLALGCLIGTVMGLPAHAPRRIRLRNCSLSRIDYQAGDWLAEGWIVETAGDISHLEVQSADEL